MSKMMPARVRSEGMALYHEGRLSEPIETSLKLNVEVDGEQVVYDLDGAEDYCSCHFFQQNHRYCQHIAAVEEYLKYQNLTELSKETREQETEQEQEHYAENVAFLDEITGATQMNFGADQYSIELKVSDGGALRDFFSLHKFLYFDLHVRSERLGRSYVIKDLPYFLRTLSHSGQYPMGGQYIDLFFDNFDEASQAFLDFVLKMAVRSDEIFAKSLFIKNGRYLSLPFLFLEEGLNLGAALSNFTLTLFERKMNYFSFTSLEGADHLFTFSVKSERDFIELKRTNEDYDSFYDGALLYFDHAFYQVTQEQQRLISALERKQPSLRFSFSERDKLAQALQQLSILGKIQAPKYFQVKAFRPKFYFDFENQETLALSMKFDYDDFEIDTFRDLETLEFSRDLHQEQRIFGLMERMGFAKGFTSHLTRSSNLIEQFFVKILPAFEKMGEVELSPTLSAHKVDELPHISIDQQGSLLDIAFSLPDVGENEFAAVIAQLKSNADYYVSDTGKFYRFDKKFDGLKAALQELDEDFQIKGNTLQVNANRTFQISKIFEPISGASFSEKFTTFFNDLTHPENFAYEQPVQIRALLRPYQEVGVRWMKMLTHYSLGGILADDMGLGKTIQTIAYLLSVLAEGESALITAPASLTYNWASEIEKFTAAVDFVVVDGTKQEREALITAKHQIYITSYGSFLKDFESYQSKALSYLLLDEAQYVKNYSSKTNRALSLLNVPHTFALSGTPLENRLEEIWSIFQVVMPGFLPNREKFNKLAPATISRMIQPFVMRRKKEEVLDELPDKMETTLYHSLAEDQKVIYLAQLELMQRQILGMDSQTLARSQIEILAGITRLRQICDTPALFLEDYHGKSGKLERLKELLEQIKDSGHRPLIFSQFTKVFPYIEQIMEGLGLSAYKLTGSTPAKERLTMVQAFNAGSRDAFLVSLKAGGVGLNLTSADVVILVDLWWNPAVEEQAIARAHRMGQKNTVEVIRLITQGTIEEKIIAIQERKKDLIANVLEGDLVDKALSEAEIREILGL